MTVLFKKVQLDKKQHYLKFVLRVTHLLLQ